MVGVVLSSGRGGSAPREEFEYDGVYFVGLLGSEAVPQALEISQFGVGDASGHDAACW